MKEPSLSETFILGVAPAMGTASTAGSGLGKLV